MEPNEIKEELVKLTLNLDKATGTLSVIADGATEETEDCHLPDAINLVADFIREKITKPLDELIDMVSDAADNNE